MAPIKRHEFEDVFKKSYGRVFNFARRLSRSTEQAEDITQEAFLQAYAAFDNRFSDRSVEHWLLRIARNVFLDAKRKEKRRILTVNESTLSEDGVLELVPDSRQSVEQLLVRATLDPEVEASLENLGAASIDLLRMAYFELLSDVEIAQRLGVKSGTVRSRIHRVCAKLRRHIGARSSQATEAA